MIIRITASWLDSPLKPREQKIRELVRAQGADDKVSFYAVIKSGTVYHAVAADVCMAILEYYAFDVRGNNDHAANIYRILARKDFNDFIYSQVGYNPTGAADIAWKQFHDRVSLSYHTVPDEYFSLFKELADMFATLLKKIANISQKFVPDISVGVYWWKHLSSENVDNVYRHRIKYDHIYPPYFSQAASNPQPTYCYPDDALAEFRKWVRDVYIREKMPSCLGQKVRDEAISAPEASAAITAFAPRTRIG